MASGSEVELVLGLFAQHALVREIEELLPLAGDLILLGAEARRDRRALAFDGELEIEHLADLGEQADVEEQIARAG